MEHRRCFVYVFHIAETRLNLDRVATADWIWNINHIFVQHSATHVSSYTRQGYFWLLHSTHLVCYSDTTSKTNFVRRFCFVLNLSNTYARSNDFHHTNNNDVKQCVCVVCVCG